MFDLYTGSASSLRQCKKPKAVQVAYKADDTKAVEIIELFDDFVVVYILVFKFVVGLVVSQCMSVI